MSNTTKTVGAYKFDRMLAVDGSRVSFRTLLIENDHGAPISAADTLAILDLHPGERCQVTGGGCHDPTVVRLVPDLFYDRGPRVWTLLWKDAVGEAGNQIGDAEHAHAREDLLRTIRMYDDRAK
jgi:hypothetical protein